MEQIPQEWIKRQIDALLGLAGKLPRGPMRDALLLRADHWMDLVKAFRERDRPGVYETKYTAEEMTPAPGSDTVTLPPTT